MEAETEWSCFLLLSIFPFCPEPSCINQKSLVASNTSLASTGLNKMKIYGLWCLKISVIDPALGKAGYRV
jgi:hypothetical protein